MAAARAHEPDPAPESVALKAADGGGTRGGNTPPPPYLAIVTNFQTLKCISCFYNYNISSAVLEKLLSLTV